MDIHCHTMYRWSLGHTACGEMFLSRDSHPRSKHEVSLKESTYKKCLREE